MELTFQHIPILPADSVIFVATDGDVNTAGEILHVGPLVDKGKLHTDRSVKIIEEITVALKNLRLVIRLCELVVNIKKLHRLGVELIRQPADPIPVHFLIGNALLDRLRGVRFKPTEKAAFPGRLYAGSIMPACFCVCPGLFCLPDVSLQALFLGLLLSGFWQSS